MNSVQVMTRCGSGECFIGTAGWSIPKLAEGFFPASGPQLQRYSRRFNAVEINSSFYRDHQPKTYQKWSDMTPDNFRFSVKLSRVFTHEKTLQSNGLGLANVFDGILRLGRKMGVLLIQFPPKLVLNVYEADNFFSTVRRYYHGPLACEPRNKSWSRPEAINLFMNHGVTKVRADPEPCPWSSEGRHESLLYYRLHGSPDLYASDYSHERLKVIADELQTGLERGAHVWCIFDNTKLGRATYNALAMRVLLKLDPVNLPQFHLSHEFMAGPE